ncbi:hypothetical protein [Pseudomonas sp. RIT-PI-AD]|uniref:hypothetical protein n=1 Tax=Pseudomonas sp. RIT-PI-AD TaxID=3035294 RepID=UPI0021DB1D4E|nr:hypothetical protein [Pseudomonas sp. RIT-PI-AD]
MARARLQAIGKSLDPVLRGSLNTTARRARKEIFVPALAPLFKRSWLNKRLVIKLAGTRRLNARIIPSSSGVPVLDRQGWRFIPLALTRARITVPGLGGSAKTAAGFVNPAGAKQQPLATRSEKARNPKRPKGGPTTYRYEWALRAALSPSVAYYFGQVANNRAAALIGSMLQQELERRLREAEAKAR